jgi:hypothetical protein
LAAQEIRNAGKSSIRLFIPVGEVRWTSIARRSTPATVPTVHHVHVTAVEWHGGQRPFLPASTVADPAFPARVHVSLRVSLLPSGGAITDAQVSALLTDR